MTLKQLLDAAWPLNRMALAAEPLPAGAAALHMDDFEPTQPAIHLPDDAPAAPAAPPMAAGEAAT
jgi:hypothetical protein